MSLQTDISVTKRANLTDREAATTKAMLGMHHIPFGSASVL